MINNPIKKLINHVTTRQEFGKSIHYFLDNTARDVYQTIERDNDNNWFKKKDYTFYYKSEDFGGIKVVAQNSDRIYIKFLPVD